MDIFKIVGKIALEGKEQFDKDVSDAKEKGAVIASAIGKGLATAAKVGVAAIGVASTAVGFLAKESLDKFAQYEQLVGGAELLFGDAYGWIADQAKTAYKDVQMSQNEYLQQVNGFAVGLKTALGGNEQAAADLASKIIRAEADIVAATGNSQEAVQNAFNGIMKSNFTMLDNLQLGITPTKDGFKALIKEVNAYNKTLGKTTNYQIDNLADCQAALVDYIEMQGLAGYAGNEAAETIQGALAMTKASWQDLLVGFADSSQDLDALIDNLVFSATTAARLIVPKLAQILGGLTTAMAEIIPVVSAELPTLMEELLPGIIEGAVGLVAGLVAVAPELVNTLIKSINQFITEKLPEMFPGLAANIKAVKEYFSDIGDYAKEAFAPAVEDVSEAFDALRDSIQPVIDKLNDYIKSGEAAKDASDIMKGSIDFLAEAYQIIVETFTNLWNNVKFVWESLGKPIWDIIASSVEIVKDVFADKMPEIQGFVSTCFSDIKGYWDNSLKPCFEAIGDFIGNVIAPIFEAVFLVGIRSIVSSGFNFIKELWEGTLKPVLTGITDFLTGVFTLDFGLAMSGILDIATGTFNSVLNGIQIPMELAKEVVNNAIDYIREKFDFEWELPRLKLPHFTITGKFSLNPPSVPSFDVSWYKKAYEEAMVLSNPTIFGYSSASGKMLGGGEGNGNEVIAGEAHLMNMIQEAVATQNDSLVFYMKTLVDMLAEYFPQVIDAADRDTVITLNNREFGRAVRSVANA